MIYIIYHIHHHKLDHSPYLGPPQVPPSPSAVEIAAQVFADAGFVLLPGAVASAQCRDLANACREVDGDRGVGGEKWGEMVDQ